MALIAATVVTRAGHDIVGAAADAAGDTFANTGVEYVLITNADASPITVTLDIVKTVDGQAVADPTVAIASGVTKVIGPFPTGIYNDGNGRAKVTYSAVVAVTIKVLKVSAS